MASTALRYAVFAGLGVLGGLALLLPGSAHAAMGALMGAAPQSPLVVDVAQDGPRFHHGKRTQSVYCLRKNYWWFYRPYTTAQEDFPRCEPYFHYPEEARGEGAGYSEPYFK